MKRLLFVLALAAALLVMSVPLLAQDVDESEEEFEALIQVAGYITFTEDGDIVVNGIIIAPAGGFIPAMLSEGDYVVIYGYMLPDNATLMAVTLVIGQEPEEEEAAEDPEEGEEVGEGDEAEDTEDGDTEEGDELEDPIDEEPVDDVATCAGPPGGHPVATAIANQFGVDYADVWALHCNGWGFGEIARAYLLAEETGEDVEHFVALREMGTGWGQIMHATGVHPSQLAPGRVMVRQIFGTTDESDAEAATIQQGQQQPGGGRPAHAGPPGNPGGGRPDHAGPPGNPGGGRPDHAGPPSNPGGGNSGGNPGGGRGRG
jgi:hypothetical protein